MAVRDEERRRGWRLRRVYLDDHLALMVAAGALVRRMLRGARGELTNFLDEAQACIEDDRRRVESLLGAIGARPSRLKQAAAALAERGGRLKPNGTLVRRSPLSGLVELEGLQLLLEGSRALWRALERAGIGPPGDAAGRAERAERLLALAERLRLEAAAAALGRR
jgi:hypothetical protein